MINKYIKIVFLCLLITACAVGNQSSKTECSTVELSYWLMDNGDSTIQSIARYTDTSRTRFIYELYYPNGALKSRCEYNGEQLISIFSVYDVNGDSLDFGTFQNGNGTVTVYDDDGAMKEIGSYIDGNRHGWWKTYGFQGDLQDSIWFQSGELEDMPGVKINLYD